MKKLSYVASIIMASLFLMSSVSVKDEKAKPKIHRIVCFKFKAGTTAEAKLKHMNEFAAFVKQVPLVLSYRAGKTVKGEQKTDPDFDVMHYLTFEKEQDILTYDAHPAHKKFVDANKASWENVLAINGAIEK
ncbi:MAG TPA: Dabb family protein [Chryseolinea sp.]|nr:Dabb family protein [Chryseolinea sp.]